MHLEIRETRIMWVTQLCVYSSVHTSICTWLSLLVTSPAFTVEQWTYAHTWFHWPYSIRNHKCVCFGPHLQYTPSVYGTIYVHWSTWVYIFITTPSKCHKNTIVHIVSRTIQIIIIQLFTDNLYPTFCIKMYPLCSLCVFLEWSDLCSWPSTVRGRGFGSRNTEDNIDNI
jgi:hypothetical protein